MIKVENMNRFVTIKEVYNIQNSNNSLIKKI